MTRVLTCACAVLSICGLALTAQAQMESPQQAHMAARLIQQQGNINLATAIQTAEQQTGGQAINADAFVPPAWQTGGTQQLKYAITCVTPNNQLQMVFIDGRNGHVESVQPAMGRMAMTGSQFMGYGQAPYGQYNPSEQQYGGWREQNRPTGQPGWQSWQPGQQGWQSWQQSGQQGWQSPWQHGYGEQGRWQGGQGGWAPSYGGQQFNQPQYWGPQQQWGGGSEFEPEEWYEAESQGQSPYGGPQQGWAGQYGQPMGGMQYGQPMGGMPMMTAHLERASKIIGDAVSDEQNQDIGHITDLAVNTFTGRVLFAVLDYNNNLYPIPLRLIQPHGNNQVALNIPQDRLASLPTLDKTNWPQSVNERLVNAVHQALGLRPEFGYAGFQAEGGAPPGAPPQTQPSGPGAQPSQEVQPGAQPIRKVTDLMNQPVHNPQNENLGTIKDLVIDPQRARLAYVVVSFNHIGDKLVAVPWDAFNIQQGKIVLNADQNRLQQVQSLSFTADNWPDMSNPEWAQHEAEVWGTQPYPMMGPGRMMGGMQGMRGGRLQQMRGGAPGQPGQQMPPSGQGGGQQPGGGYAP